MRDPLTTAGPFIKKWLFGYFSLFETSRNLYWYFWTFTINHNYVWVQKSHNFPQFFPYLYFVTFLYLKRVCRSVAPSLFRRKVSPNRKRTVISSPTWCTLSASPAPTHSWHPGGTGTSSPLSPHWRMPFHYFSTSCWYCCWRSPAQLSSNLLLLGCPQQNLGGVHGRMEGRGQHFQRLLRARLHRTCLGYRVLLQPWVFEVCLTINIHRPWGCPCKHQQGQSPVLYCARAASGSLSIPPPSSRERWMGSKGDSPFPLVTVYLYFTLAAQASIS